MLNEAPEPTHPAKGTTLDQVAPLEGFFELKTLRSNDPQYPAGYTAAGRVEVSVQRLGEELIATFNWLSRQPTIHYSISTAVQPGPGGGFVFGPSQIGMFILYEDSCSHQWWEEKVEQVSRGQGSVQSFGVDMAIRREVYHLGSTNHCDPPPEGTYKRLVQIDAFQAQGCFGDEVCPESHRCNAAEQCLLPPGCELGQLCAAVCYGWCKPYEVSTQPLDD